MTVPVPSMKADSSAEQFNISFNENADGGDMILHWDTTKVVVPIK